jgi:hypothetical protein
MSEPTPSLYATVLRQSTIRSQLVTRFQLLKIWSTKFKLLILKA